MPPGCRPAWPRSPRQRPDNISGCLLSEWLSWCVFSRRSLGGGNSVFWGSIAAHQVHGPSHQVLYNGCIQAVPDLLAIAATGEQVGFFQYREMVRHGRLGHVEALGEVAGGHLAAAQETEDLAAGRIGDCLERFVGGRGHI